MAVTRADKEAELQLLEAAFKGSDSAILVDYKGLNVPQVTELRRQLRVAKAKYKVVKNTIARRAIKGTSYEVLDKFFEGTTGVAYTTTDVDEGLSGLQARTVFGYPFLSEPDLWVNGPRRRLGVEARIRPGPASINARSAWPSSVSSNAARARWSMRCCWRPSARSTPMR